MLANDLVSTIIAPLKTSDTVRSSLDKMTGLELQHLPIVNETGLLLGVLAEHDLLQVPEDQEVGSIRIALLLSYVYEYQHVFDILKMINEQKLSLVPVTDQKNGYLGSVLKDDLLSYCSKLTSSMQPGGMIVLEMNENDLSMSEIVKIIESNNARILSYFTETQTDASRLLVTLKLNKTDINPILATFERFNYMVRFSFQQDQFRDDTRDRYESFMNYLNM